MLARALIAVLLTMNLGVGLWLWLRPAVGPTPTALSGGMAQPSLVLLHEELGSVEPQDPAAEPDGPPEPPTDFERLLCMEVGPFLTQADLRRAMSTLAPSVEHIQFRESRTLANRGYWVFLPAFASRDAALAKARELAATGLRDYYVVTAGERENMISLGLFRHEENARKRFEQVRALGFDAKLQSRKDEIPEYWIDLAVSPQHDLGPQLAAYPDVSGKPTPCRRGARAASARAPGD